MAERLCFSLGGRHCTPAVALAFFLLTSCVTEPRIDPTISILEDAQTKLAEQVAAIATQITKTASGDRSTSEGNTGGLNVTGNPITTLILAAGLVVSGWVTPTPASVWKKLFCGKKCDKPPEQLR